MTNKNLINRNADANDSGGAVSTPGRTIVYPKHDFGLNKTFKGRYLENTSKGYVFEGETGKVLIPGFERVNEAIAMITPGTLLEFIYEGEGEFTINAPEME